MEELLTLQSFLWKLGSIHYVYAICEPDGTPFYVGKGTGSRIKCHEDEAADLANCESKHQMIRQIKDNGLEVRYAFIGLFSNEDDAHQEEKRLIAKYGRRDNGTGILTNLTNGGEGYVKTFFSEKWKTDENDERILGGVGKPSQTNLLPPRCRSVDDAIMEVGEDGESFVKGWKKPEKWTGPEQPLLAQWQGHGLTVQVFFFANTSVGLQEWLRDSFNKDKDMVVLVRVFDGERKIFEDTSAFFPFHPGSCGLSLRSKRPQKPSKARLAAEQRIVAIVLSRLVAMADELGGRVRYDWECGRIDWTKQQQAWIQHNYESLRRITTELDVAAGEAD